MIGTTTSHYQILEKLGEGGMGVVYRAHDTKLDRDVALKFLPAHLNASEQDKARFMQEAKAAATLDHPSICTIHSIEEHEGRIFIVMQFIDGQLLRDRMSGLSVKQAIDIGIQVAEGLAAAHEKGIVHRDIKPENIIVRKDGIVQIMDFGLAKLKGVSRLTKEGSTVGTAGYMSPEQIQGQDADHRSDIFSLGVLLHEMITGQLPFKGIHESAISYEIVNVDAVPMSTIKSEITPELDNIVLECLEKEPSERYQSTAEIAKELRRVRRQSSRERTTRIMKAAQTQSTAGEDRPPARPALSLTRFLWPAVSAILAIALAMVMMNRSDTDESSPVMRFSINLPPSSPLIVGSATLAIAPDGKNIVYRGLTRDSREILYLRPLDRLDATPMPGSEGASDPFFSPDGQWVAFFAYGKFRKLSIFGGAAQDICAIQGFIDGACWGSDNTIFFGNINSSIYRVPANGGIPVEATHLDTVQGEISHRFPQVIPDSKWILFTVKKNNIASFNEAIIVAENLDTHERRDLVNGGSFARYLPTGHIMYARGASLYAVPFDKKEVRVTGPPLPVIDGGMLNPFSGTANYEISRTGVLIYAPLGPLSGLDNVVGWMDRTGTITPILKQPRPYDDLRLSSDDSKIAMTIRAANDDIWVYDLARGALTRLTFGGGNSVLPDWTPDRKRVLFYSERGKEIGLFWKSWDGSGAIERMGDESEARVNLGSTFTPDGKAVIYSVSGDLWTVSAGGEQKRKPLLQSASLEEAPRMSPDGGLLAYLSDESGRLEVYVVPYPGLNGKWQISSGGATSPPVWGAKGRELFYTEQGNLMKVDVSGEPSVTFSPPKKVCSLPPSFYSLNGITRDGTKFLVAIASKEDVDATHLNVVVGWSTELRRKFASMQK